MTRDAIVFNNQASDTILQKNRLQGISTDRFSERQVLQPELTHRLAILTGRCAAQKD